MKKGKTKSLVKIKNLEKNTNSKPTTNINRLNNNYEPLKAKQELLRSKKKIHINYEQRQSNSFQKLKSLKSHIQNNPSLENNSNKKNIKFIYENQLFPSSLNTNPSENKINNDENLNNEKILLKIKKFKKNIKKN